MANTKNHLSKYNVSDLKKIASRISVKNYSKLKKDDLIEEIISRLKTEEAALYAYKFIDEDSFNHWKAKSENNEEQAEFVLEDIFGLYILGFAFESEAEEDKYFITKEATDLFNQVDSKEHFEERLEVQRKLNVVRASLHLYGIVPMDQLIHLFDKYYDKLITKDELFAFLEQSPYDITINRDTDEIIIDDMTEDQYESVKKIQGNRSFYEPEFPKFIKFSHPAYIDESEDHVFIKEWLEKNLDTSKHEHMYVYISLLQMVLQGAKRDMISKYLMSVDLEFKNVEEQHAFFKATEGVLRNTRHFKYRGHKESELKTKTIVLEEKVGRNDPCPCGSGKKYKKCCGR